MFAAYDQYHKVIGDKLSFRTEDVLTFVGPNSVGNLLTEYKKRNSFTITLRKMLDSGFLYVGSNWHRYHQDKIGTDMEFLCSAMEAARMMGGRTLTIDAIEQTYDAEQKVRCYMRGWLHKLNVRRIRGLLVSPKSNFRGNVYNGSLTFR